MQLFAGGSHDSDRFILSSAVAAPAGGRIWRAHSASQLAARLLAERKVRSDRGPRGAARRDRKPLGHGPPSELTVAVCDISRATLGTFAGWVD